MWSPERIGEALDEAEEALDADAVEESLAVLTAVEPHIDEAPAGLRARFLVCHARCLVASGQMPEAASVYQSAWELERDPDIGFAAAYCAIDARLLDTARELLDAMLKERPDDRRARLERAFLDLKQGLFRSAIGHLPAAEGFEDHVLRCRLAIECGAHADAEEAYGRAEQAAGNDEERALVAKLRRRFDLPQPRDMRDEVYVQSGALLLELDEHSRLDGLAQAHLLAQFHRLCVTGFVRAASFAAGDRRTRPFAEALNAALDLPAGESGAPGVWTLYSLWEGEKPAPPRSFALAVTDLESAPPAVVGRIAEQGLELEPLPGDRRERVATLQALFSSVELERSLEDWLNARRGLLFERGPGREERSLKPVDQVDLEHISLRDLGSFIAHDPAGMRAAVLEGKAWDWLPLLRAADSPFIAWGRGLVRPEEALAAHVRDNPAAFGTLAAAALQGRAASLPGSRPFGGAAAPAEAETLEQLLVEAALSEDPDVRLAAVQAYCRADLGEASLEACLASPLGPLTFDADPQIANLALATVCRLPGGLDHVRRSLEQDPGRLGVELAGRLLLSGEEAAGELFCAVLASIEEQPIVPLGITALSCLEPDARLALLEELPEVAQAAAVSLNIRALGAEARELVEGLADELLLAPHLYIFDWFARCDLLEESWVQDFLGACLCEEELRYAAAGLLVAGGRPELCEVLELGWRRLTGLQQEFPLVARFLPAGSAAHWTRPSGPELVAALDPLLEVPGRDDACPEVFAALRAQLTAQASDPASLWRRTRLALDGAPRPEEARAALEAEVRLSAWESDIPVPFLPWPAPASRPALAYLRYAPDAAEAYLRGALPSAPPWQQMRLLRALEECLPAAARELAAEYEASPDAELRAWAQELRAGGETLA